MEEKLIGIGGGVGPMAGVELHRKIIQFTTAKGDKDHLQVLHASLSNIISDRTGFLLGEVNQNPAEGMLQAATSIYRAAEILDKQVVFGVPCNTFHASPIFDRFLELLKENNIDMQVLHMIEETADFMRIEFPSTQKIGLMSTTGTRKVGVYNKVLEPYGFEIIEVPLSQQDELHEAIYNPTWGIKSKSNPVTPTAHDKFLSFANILKIQGAEVIILGCTEIPLALPEAQFEDIPLVDPMTVLARALIREAAREKLRPLII